MEYRIQTAQQRSGDHLWAYRILGRDGVEIEGSAYNYFDEKTAIQDAHQKILRLEDADGPSWKDVD